MARLRMPVALTLAGAGIAAVGGLAGGVQRTAQRDRARVRDADAIFLVAYATGDDGRPSPRYRDRLAIAARLHVETGLPVWCLAGTLSGRSHSNGQDSKRHLVSLGVPAAAIRTLDEFPFLGGQSFETIQETEAATAVARHLGSRRLVVISDALQLAQVRLVLPPDIDARYVLSPSIPSRLSADDLYYVAVRCATLLLTLVDRRGRGLGWLRAWRRG